MRQAKERVQVVSDHLPSVALAARRLPRRLVAHGCRWETFCIFAYCGLVGNPHLTAKVQFCCSPSNANRDIG